ncbi:tyrosine-type recombinase/integrase [Nocardia suismassiliense]|uniref:tyrosine-type recombinase/integrase n=1 Tax=Nocardia suismassiliense TaxID=2077092 RepID=UPI000D1DD6F6|nr:site-specific integrase [Nocardia suismassiliense]
MGTDPVRLIPLGVEIRADIEERNRATPFRARVRWTDPISKARPSKSAAFDTREEAEEWVSKIRSAAARGVDPKAATATLKDYGDDNWAAAMRGLEEKTAGDAYLPAWNRRVVPALGHIPVTMITAGLADRAVMGWIADGVSKSAVKNSLAALSRVLDQAVRDEVIDRNRVEVSGWQRQYERYEDELDDPRSLALPDWLTLTNLADALVAASADGYRGWGDVVIFAACTAVRIGEVSGCRVDDIDTTEWVWRLRRQTSPGPGGLKDKGTKGKRSRRIPIIENIRPLVLKRIQAANSRPDARLFVGPRGGRIQTGVLRKATHWHEVVAKLGYEHLRRHDLRHTGLTWFADAGVPLHRLQQIAGHTDPRITQRYLHPDIKALQNDGDLLSRFLTAPHGGPQIPELLAAMDSERSPNGPQLRIVK